MLAWALLVIGAGATIEVAPETCTSSSAVAQAVLAQVEAPLTLTVTATTGGVLARFSLPGAPAMTRRLEVRPADCPVLPQLLALMAERYVRALPRHTWARRAGPVGLDVQARTSLPPTPVERRPRYALAAAAAAGATVGASGVGPGLEAVGRVELYGAHLGVAAGLGARVIPRVAFGAGGELRVTAPWLELSLAARAHLGPLPLHARLGMGAGVAVGEARGFEAASTDVTALIEPALALDLAVPRGLTLSLEGRIRAVGPRFTGPDPSIAYEAPLLRVGVLLGVRRAVAFF